VYEISLATEPTADVTVTVGGDGQISFDTTTLTFTPTGGVSPWDTPQQVTVTAIDDGITEPQKTVQIQHAVSSPGDARFHDSEIETVAVSVTDNDTAIVSVSAESKSEGTGVSPTTFTFSIQISNPVEHIVGLVANTQDGTATAVEDYSPVSGQVVSFASGDTTTQTIDVDVSADPDVELDELFDLVLSGIAAGGLDVIFDGEGSTLTSTATIQNDDEAPPPPQVVDNSDPEFTTVGSWTRVANKPQVQERDFLYNGSGTGADKATWDFTGVTPGLYRVSVSYRAFRNRAANAPYTIRDGAALLATVPVNQQQVAGSLVHEGIPFHGFQ